MIRRMTEDDIPDVLELMRTLRDESPVFSRYPADEPYVREQLSLMVHSPIHIMLIDDCSRGVMFGCTTNPWWSPYYEANEMLLAVFPAYRNSSVAARLIREFEQECVRRGCRAINVGANLGIDDDIAEALYRRLGYTTFGHALTKRLD